MTPRAEVLIAGRLRTETGEQWEVIGGGAAPVTGVGVARQDGTGWRRWLVQADAGEAVAPTAWQWQPVALWVGLPHEHAGSGDCDTFVAWFPSVRAYTVATDPLEVVDLEEPEDRMLRAIVRAHLPQYRDVARVPDAILAGLTEMARAIDEDTIEEQDRARDELVGVLADHINDGNAVGQAADRIEEALRALHLEVHG